VEIAHSIAALVHPRDTTPERRSPGHLAMTGAPVQLAVVLFEERPNGSGGRTRTADPVVNSHLLYRLSYAGTKRVEDLARNAPNVKGFPTGG